MKKISEFLSENFKILEVKFSIYLNRSVFVLQRILQWSDGAPDWGLIYLRRYTRNN